MSLFSHRLSGERRHGRDRHVGRGLTLLPAGATASDSCSLRIMLEDGSTLQASAARFSHETGGVTECSLHQERSPLRSSIRDGRTEFSVITEYRLHELTSPALITLGVLLKTDCGDRE
jgi:hypothetical protein